jgi:hypothetical protein
VAVRIHNDSAEATINLAGFSPEQKTAVAVAGVLGEARRGGQLGDNWLPVAARMTCHYFYRHETYPGQVFPVPLAQAGPVDVSFSDEDFFQIHHEFQGNALKLAEVVENIAGWINANWGAVQEVAERLLQNDEATGEELVAGLF